MHRAKRPSTDFLLDGVLIYAMYGSTIVFTIAVFRMSIERFLMGSHSALVWRADRLVIDVGKHIP